MQAMRCGDALWGIPVVSVQSQNVSLMTEVAKVGAPRTTSGDESGVVHVVGDEREGLPGIVVVVVEEKDACG